MSEVKLVSGEGVFLEYSDGSRMLDASNTGCPLGHSHPAMAQAIKEAASFPVANEGQPWLERVAAAEELAALANEAAGKDWVGKVVFGLSGSEVNDIALSFAQALTGRSALVTRERAYHGLVGLSRDATVQPQWHCGLSYANPPRVSAPQAGVEMRVIPAPDGAIYRCGEDDMLFEGDLESAFREKIEGSAAVIVDYTQGGRYYDGAEYQDALSKVAQESGALWIDDEVVSGLGRSGSLFMFQNGSTTPDIMTMGKPLSGGATPAGAVVLSKRVVGMMGDAIWQNYSTFRGHPLMVHAMRAHMEMVKAEDLPGRADRMGKLFSQELLRMAKDHPCVSRVAGRGLHWTVEFFGKDWREWTSTSREKNISDYVVGEARARGVRISTSDEPSSLFLAPPLVISELEAEQIFEALDAGLSAGDSYLESIS